jgi:hypothetical protein
MKYLFALLIASALFLQIKSDLFVSRTNNHNTLDILGDKAILTYTQFFGTYFVEFKYDETFPEFHVYASWGGNNYCNFQSQENSKHFVEGFTNEQCDRILLLLAEKGVQPKKFNDLRRRERKGLGYIPE